MKKKNLWNHSNIGFDMDEHPIGLKEVTDKGSPDLPENDHERPRDLNDHVTLEVIDENEDRLDDSFYQIFWVNIIYGRLKNKTFCS